MSGLSLYTGSAKNPERKDKRFVALMRPEDIRESVLTTLDIVVTVDDLRRPIPALVEQLYSAFLQEIFELDFDDYMVNMQAQPYFSATHAETFRVMLFRHYLNILLGVTASIPYVNPQDNKVLTPVAQFTFSDLTNPDPIRTRIILTGMIHMTQFQATKMDLITESHKSYMTLSEKIDAVNASNERLRNQAEQFRAKREGGGSELAEKEAKAARMRQAREEEKQRRKDAHNHTKLLKDKLRGLQQQRYELDRAVKTGEDRLKEHRNQVVRSPERVRKEIKDFGDAMKRQRVDFAEREESARAFHTKIEHLKVLETECRTALETLNLTAAESQKLKSANEELKDVGSDIDKKRTELEGLTSRKERLEMQLTHANDRLARAKASASSAQAAVMERMEQLKVEYNTLSSDRQTNDEQLAALSLEATSIENDIATHVAENQLAMQKVLTEYHRLKQQWDSYMTTMIKTLNLPVSS